MDKEAQDNLIVLRDALDFQINEWWGGLRQQPYETNYRRSLMSLLKNLGYRKLPEGEPPLLSDEEINNIPFAHPRFAAEAQRQLDKKFYRG